MTNQYVLSRMGKETWELVLKSGHTVLNCHHSNDVKDTTAQWEYFRDVYLPLHPNRVYKVGDNNSQLVQINPTTIQVLEKDSDDVKCTIDFGRRVIVKNTNGVRIPSTIKTRLVTTQAKVNKPSCADIDDIIVILGVDEQNLDVSSEHWVEEFGVKITDPVQPIGLTFGTDHRTACAQIKTTIHVEQTGWTSWFYSLICARAPSLSQIQTITIQSKNLCGESDALPSGSAPPTNPIGQDDVEVNSEPNSDARLKELEQQFGDMDTNIFEFMTAGTIARFNNPENLCYRDAWESCIKQTTDDLGLFEGKTFGEMWKTKMISDKKGLRNATWVNIHNLVPASYHTRAEYLDLKFKSEYAKWVDSDTTNNYCKQIAKYWIHFKELLMTNQMMMNFFKMAFDEINSVTKITMEQDLLNEMEHSRTDIICLQEISVIKYQKLTSPEFQAQMNAFGYILSVPPLLKDTKTLGGVIVKKTLV
jgi:hypothetical protein